MPTLFSNIINIDQTISTNDYASKLLKTKKAKEGTVIFANFQTKGKGQREANWESESGKNILTSMIISPRMLIRNQFIITIFISLALYDLLHKYFEKRVKIKWPNDILIADKKIAGILIQNIVRRDIVKDAIVGIGLNVNQTQITDYSTKATSFALELEQKVALPLLQNELLVAVEHRYLQFQDGKLEAMKSEFLTKLFGFNQFRDYIIEDKKTKAKIIDIDESGQLVLAFEDGSTKAFSLKEIKYLI